MLDGEFPWEEGKGRLIHCISGRREEWRLGSLCACSHIWYLPKRMIQHKFLLCVGYQA